MLVELSAAEIGIVLRALNANIVDDRRLTARLYGQLPPFEIRRPKTRVRPEALPDAVVDGEFMREWSIFAVHGDTCDDVVRAVAAHQHIHMLYDGGYACDVETIDESGTNREINDESVLREVTDAGLTIVKLPDRLGSPYWRWYVVDLDWYVCEVFREVFNLLSVRLGIDHAAMAGFIDMHVRQHGAYSEDCFSTTEYPLQAGINLMIFRMDASGFYILWPYEHVEKERYPVTYSLVKEALPPLYSRWFDYMAQINKER